MSFFDIFKRLFKNATNADASELKEEPVVSSESETDTIVSSESETDTVVSSESETDTIVSSESDKDTVVSSESETDTVVSSEAERDTVVSSESETDTIVSSDVVYDRFSDYSIIKEEEIIGFMYDFKIDECEICSYKGSAKKVIIPAYLGGRKVVKIRDSVNPGYIYRSENRKELEEVYIPKTVKVIDASFFSCIKKVYFEKDSELERITFDKFSVRICLEEANFPEGADLSGLFRNVIITPEATFFTKMPRDEQGILSYRGYHIDGLHSLEVYDTKDAEIVCLKWITEDIYIDKIIIRSKVKEIVFPVNTGNIGDFEVVGNDLFIVEDGVLYKKNAKRRNILHVNKSRTNNTLTIGENVTGELPQINNKNISTVIIEPRLKIHGHALNLEYVRTIVSKNKLTKFETWHFVNYSNGVNLYTDSQSLKGLAKNEKLIVHPLDDYLKNSEVKEDTETNQYELKEKYENGRLQVIRILSDRVEFAPDYDGKYISFSISEIKVLSYRRKTEYDVLKITSIAGNSAYIIPAIEDASDLHKVFERIKSFVAKATQVHDDGEPSEQSPVATKVSSKKPKAAMPGVKEKIEQAERAIDNHNLDRAKELLSSIPPKERTGEYYVALLKYNISYSFNTISLEELEDLANKAAELGAYRAYEFMGVVFSCEQFHLFDKEKAIEYFKFGAENGDVCCMNSYANKLDEKGEHYEAVKWFRKAAELGHRTSQYNLALKYEFGTVVEKDIDKALYWYEKAAENGDEDAPIRIKWLKHRKALIAAGKLTQEEIDGDFDIEGENGREFTIEEKKAAIARYKSLTGSPPNLLGYYIVNDEFFESIQKAEAGDADMITRYMASALKHIKEGEDLSKNKLFMYWERKVIENKPNYGMALLFSKIMDDPTFEDEAYICATYIRDNPCDSFPEISPVAKRWLKTHYIHKKSTLVKLNDRIFEDRTEMFDSTAISLLKDLIVIEDMSLKIKTYINYEDITTLEFINNGYYMVLRIYDIKDQKGYVSIDCFNCEKLLDVLNGLKECRQKFGGIDSDDVKRLFEAPTEGADIDRLYNVFNDIQERLPDKDRVQIVDKKDELPDEATIIENTEKLSRLGLLPLDSNQDKSEDFDAIFEQKPNGTYEVKVELNKKHKIKGGYSFRVKFNTGTDCSSDKVSYEGDEMSQSNAVPETLDFGGFSIPVLDTSEAKSLADTGGCLQIGDRSYDIFIEAVIDRYYDGNWSAKLSFDKAERYDDKSLILTFRIRCIKDRN